VPVAVKDGRPTRGQLSLEVLVYLGISAAALAFSLSLFTLHGTQLEDEINAASISMMVSSINSNMGYSSSYTHIYIPKAVCSADSSADGITYLNTTYYFSDPLEITGKSFCVMAGEYASISISYNGNGTYSAYG
jgi:hypothetical protein